MTNDGWLMTDDKWLMTDDNDWWASTIIIYFDAKDEIHTINAKLCYILYYSSLTVVGTGLMKY